MSDCGSGPESGAFRVQAAGGAGLTEDAVMGRRRRRARPAGSAASSRAVRRRQARRRTAASVRPRRRAMSSRRRPPSSASRASARRTAMSSLGIQRRSMGESTTRRRPVPAVSPRPRWSAGAGGTRWSVPGTSRTSSTATSPRVTDRAVWRRNDGTVRTARRVESRRLWGTRDARAAGEPSGTGVEARQLHPRRGEWCDGPS